MKPLLFSLLVLGLATPALAQTQPGPAEPSPADRVLDPGDRTAGTSNDFSADPKP